MNNGIKKIPYRIFFLVGIQIAIIITSFFVLEVSESEQIFQGNAINIAGKNRFLTEMVLNAVKDNYIGEKLTGDPISALEIYEQNLQLLKIGGTQMGITLSPLSKENIKQWENIHSLYLDYQSKIQSFVKSDSADKETKLAEISSLADKLVKQNDILTANLASDSQNSNTAQRLLQVLFVIINIGTLLFMIKLVYDDLKIKASKMMKMKEDNAANRKYRALYEGLPDLCRTINEDGIILDCNTLYANTLGYSKEEVIGKSIFEHVAEKSFSSLRDSFTTWKNSGHVRNKEIWFKRKDGSIFPVSLNATRTMDENNKYMTSNTVIRDLTDIYDIKKELEEQKIKRLSAIGELAARLAHDLRNPLSVLRNTIEILKIKYSNNSLDSASFNTHCTKIDNAISRISHQIDDVLDFVRISPLNLSEISLVPFVKNICKKISHSKNIEIEVSNNHYVITADEKKLEIVLTNLLLNSVEAIGDKPGKIIIRFIKNNVSIIIKISDTGSGIPEDIKDKIFEPLFTTKQKGTGLGLVSCKTIVEQHGGTITVQNNPTTFTIVLPITMHH